jgi:hypothetical protein
VYSCASKISNLCRPHPRVGPRFSVAA